LGYARINTTNAPPLPQESVVSCLPVYKLELSSSQRTVDRVGNT